MKTYKNRNSVEKKYKWDISFLLEGKTIEQQMKSYETQFKALIKVKDSKYNSEKEFLTALKKEDKLLVLSNKIENYLSNWTSEDVTNPLPNQLIQKFSFMHYNLNQEMGPETPRIFANEAKIKKYLKSPSLKDYISTYTRILETKKHQLPKAIQEYRNKASRGNIDVAYPFSVLTDAELQFPLALDSKGKKHKIGHDNISKILKNKDATLRKNGIKSYREGYLQVKQTLSNFIFQHFKEATVEAKLHKFDNTIQHLIYGDRGSEKLLLTQYATVQKYVPLLKKAKAIHKKAFKAKYGVPMKSYDYMMPIVNVKSEMTTEEQKKLVLDSFKPFGKEYTDVVKKAFSDSWIDYKAYPGKRTGAYSIGGTYGVDKKLILMNDSEDIRSAETLAHELGHSMHSYFSDKNQHVRESSYKIFVAEIASIFNELMFFDHMLKISDNDKLKLQILHQMVEGFDGTVFRQTEWSNYEYDLYNAIEKGESISTYEAISDLYFNNHKKYATKPPKEKDKSKLGYNGIRVPHFYYGFYVYKYSIGQIVANIFFNRYKKQGKESLQDYIKNFLSMGGKLQPLELLKHNGIDLEDPKTYEEGFANYAENIKTYSKLVNKVYPKKVNKK